MKILFIGDPHLKINKLDLNIKFLSWLNNLTLNEKPDLVVNLGDTFDTHAVIRSEIMNEFMSHVDYINNMNIPYVYVVGNHDMFKPNDSRYHALKPFKDKSKLFHVVDEVTELFGITFVPYCHDSSKFPSNLNKICVAHQTFLGADFGPILAKDGVMPSTLKGADIIISGHIHKRQTLVDNSGGPDVLYVGSPFSQNASDVDQIKGITIFDTATYEQKFIETPLPSWKKISFIVSKPEDIEILTDTLCTSVNTKDNWILELEGNKPEIVSYLSSSPYINAIKGVSIKVKTIFTEKEKKKISIEAKSMDNIVSDYIAKVYSGVIDKQALLEAAKSVLK